MSSFGGDSPGASINPSDAGQTPGAAPSNSLVKKVLGENKAYLVPTPMHPALKESPSFWLLVRALQRRWLPALIVGVFVAAAVSVTLWFVAPPPKQMARSLLQISAVQPKVFFTTMDGYSFEMFQRSQAAFIKSRFVLNAALQEPGVKNKKLTVLEEQADPIQWLERELKVDFNLGPEILRISLDGKDTKELVALVDAVTKAYLRDIVNKEKEERLNRIDKLKQLYRKYEGKIEVNKQKLRDLVDAVGLENQKDASLKQSIALQLLYSSRNELVGLKSDLRRLAGKIAYHRDLEPEGLAMLYGSCYPQTGFPVQLALAALLNPKNNDGASFSQKMIDDILNDDSKIKNYQAEVKRLEWKIHAEQSVGEDSWVLRNYQKNLVVVRKLLADRRKELRPKVIAEVRARAKMESRASLNDLYKEKDALQIFENRLEQDIKDLDKESRNISKANLDLGALNEDLAILNATFNSVLKEINTLEVEREAPPRVKPLEDAVAYVPDGNKQRIMMAGVGGLGSLALVLFVFAWVEFRGRKVNSPDEVIHGLGINLMGTLPDFGYRPRQSRWLPSGKSTLYWDNLLTDSVDALRTMMLFTARTEGLQVVMVTSAMSGEGKTFSASHIAASLARAGRKTLLLDCDLRNPNAHRLFDLPRGPGLSEILRGEKEVADAIQATQVEGLSVIPGGQADVQAIQALAQDKIGKVFEQVRKQFDFVVVDSSPVMPVPDALLMAQNADAVIFSILRGVSRIPKIYAAYQRLSMLGIRILGAVVNGTRDEVYTNYGYTYAVQKEE